MYWLFDTWETSLDDEIETAENLPGLLNRKRSKSINIKANPAYQRGRHTIDIDVIKEK